MNKDQTEERRRLAPGDRFKFSCHNRVPCFNTCCADINIFLTPYDVLRMRRSTGLASGEFLQRYTLALLADEGLPLVVLKMMKDENKRCPFVTLDGCKIYPDRPWSCRMYPLFPASSTDETFLVADGKTCLGFEEEKQWTIDEWKKIHEIDIYDQMNELYREITYHDYFQKGNKLDSGRAKLLYRAFYDLSEFKRFLFESRFFDIYDVEKELIDKIRHDEQELLKFGYRWIKFNVFGEDSVRVKDKAVDKILQDKREKADNSNHQDRKD